MTDTTTTDILSAAALIAEADTPVLTGMQAQGDVLVIPVSLVAERLRTAAPAPIPAAGVAVVEGENGRNTHLLVGQGRWAPAQDPGLDIGIVTVAEGQTAWLQHPEHPALGVGCGTYIVRRQRTQADEVRAVAD